MKRFLKILLLLVVVFVIFCAYIFFVPHGGARRELAKYKKQLMAQGEKLDLMSFVPALPKGVSNGAPEFLNIITNWQRPNDFPPLMRMVAQGVAAIGHTNLSIKDMANCQASKTTAQKLRAILDSSVLDFNLDYSNAPIVRFPQIAHIKSATLLFSQTAAQALYTNDLAEALLDASAGADLARLTGKEPMEISTMIRIACANIAINTAWELLQRDGWNDAQLDGLQSKWQQMDFFTNQDTVLAGERAIGIVGMAHARKATNAAQLEPFAGLTGASTGTSFGERVSDLFHDPKAALKDVYERYPKFWMWKSKWSYEEELCGIQLTTAAIETCRRIQATGFCAPALQELSIQLSNTFSSYPQAESHFLAGATAMGEIWPRLLVKTAQTETSRRLLVTAIALKRFHLRQGKWPEKLDELVPDFLPQVPIDFMDGKPLRYKPANDGRYLLYSVGEDGKDDGGDGSPPPPDPGETPGTKLVHFLGMRDIVWPQPTSFEEYRQHITNLIRSATNAPDKTLPPPAK